MEPAVHCEGDVQEERPELHPPAGDCDAAVPRDCTDYDLVVQHKGELFALSRSLDLRLVVAFQRALRRRLKGHKKYMY